MPFFRRSPGAFNQFSADLAEGVNCLYNAAFYITGNHTQTQKLILSVFRRQLVRHFFFKNLLFSRDRLLAALWKEYRRLMRRQGHSGHTDSCASFENDFTENQFSGLFGWQDREFDGFIASTNPTSRFALVLVDVERFHYSLAARIMGCSQNQLQSFLRRGREAYRRIVEIAVPARKESFE